MSFFLDVLYMAAGVLGSPYWLYKLARSGKLRTVLRGKFELPPQRTTPAPAVWLHCASVGEVLLARGLIAGLARQSHDTIPLISCNTPTGCETAKKHFEYCPRFYSPADFSGLVARAFRRLRPSMLVLMELELWPNLILGAHRRGVPVAIVNGRITERAARRYRRIGPLIRWVLGKVDLFAMQSQEYADRLIDLGADRAKVHVTGSMKYDNLSTDQQPDAELARTLGIDPAAEVIVGGCTYAGEDEPLIDIYRDVRRTHPALRLILAPRHPERFDAVEAAIGAAGLNCLRRSALGPDGPPSNAPADAVILIDKMGELERVYSLASVAFVGGSLIPRGGHNIMEPAGRGKAVLAGPHTGNFAEAVAGLLQVGGLIAVANTDELRRQIQTLIDDPQQARQVGDRARRAVIKAQGATQRTIELLLALSTPRT